MHKRSKPRLALFGLGVLGGGPIGQGIPVLANLFQRLSLDYEIVFYCFQSTDKNKIPNTIKTRHVASKYLPGRLNYAILSFQFLIDSIFSPYRLIMAVSIFPAGKWAVRVGKLWKLPVVIQLVDHEAIDLPEDIMHVNRKLSWFRNLTNEVCKNAAALVALSDDHRRHILRSLSFTPDIAVLPLRIDIGKFGYVERSVLFPVQFVHIGYYSAIKDQNTMFATFAAIATVIDCRLTVIGEGFNTPVLHRLLSDLKIADKVSFAGIIKNSELPGYLGNAHILLHTARFEAEPIVIQEAMASGVLVCGTRVGTLADIGDRYAVIAPIQNAHYLAQKILAIINDPASYQQIKKEAHHWIATHASEWSYNNYKCFLEEMINNALD